MIPVFTGKVTCYNANATSLIVPRILFDKPLYYADYLKTLTDKNVEVIVRKQRAQRSNNQNNYYFGVVCKILGDYFGYTEDEMHEALKIHFLTKGACDIPTVGSTAKMNTAEFEDYLTKIKRWAASEYGVIIPDPNEIDVPEVTPNRYPEQQEMV